LVANTLIEKEKITGTEMLQIIQKIRPDLVSNDQIKKVQEFAKPIVEALSPASDEPTPIPAPAEA
jgi:predicted RNase H-like nuclease (RuvC/YqgF family)